MPGMAYLRFDGASKEMLDRATQPAFKEADRFFKRPLAEKQTAIAPNLPPGVTRGYLGTGAESGAETFEWKEAFSWSYAWDRMSSPQNGLEHRNVWPTPPSGGSSTTTDEGMQASFDALFTFMGVVMSSLVDALLAAWPSSFGAVPDLRALSRRGETISLLRAFHYHAACGARPEMTGSCEHTDWGFATLIAQAAGADAALQVRVDGRWVDVPGMADALVVNCSDFLSLLTDGRLRSPVHRVVLGRSERTSFVYFHYPGFDTGVPRMSQGGKERTSGLYLLKNQGEDVNDGDAHGAGRLQDLTFGELIAQKWEQVKRG